MPLIMEPESEFYTSPLLVLDFQSLYPSVMIAYNYCYSTCLGRVAEFKGNYKFGVIPHLDISPPLLEKLHDHINGAHTWDFFFVGQSNIFFFSCPKWYYVRKTDRSQRSSRSHASGITRYKSHGEASNETRRG